MNMIVYFLSGSLMGCVNLACFAVNLGLTIVFLVERLLLWL